MGYLRHETMVVSNWDVKRVRKLHRAAIAIFEKHGMDDLVGSVTKHLMNGGGAFFIAPDGSKEGWSHSDDADKARKEFIAWMRDPKQNDLYPEWALILLGGDDGEYAVLDSPANALPATNGE